MTEEMRDGFDSSTSLHKKEGPTFCTAEAVLSPSDYTQPWQERRDRKAAAINFELGTSKHNKQIHGRPRKTSI